MLVEPTGQEVKTTAGHYEISTDREKEPQMSIKIHFRAVILQLERATRPEFLN